MRFRGQRGCEHGVSPLGAPDELGLAVEAGGEEVFGIEDAQDLYSGSYELRFDRPCFEVAGRVLNRDGRFIWVGLMVLAQGS